MPFKGPIARATLRTSFVLGLRVLAQAGTLLLLAHLLGPARFGAFAALAALAVLFGTLATFGANITLLRDLSRDASRRDAVLRCALGVTALCGSLLLALYLALAFAWLRLDAVDAPVAACVGVAELLLQPFLLLASSERHARGEVARSQWLSASPQFLRLPVAAAVMVADPANPLLAYALGHVAATAIALWFALAAAPEPWPTFAHWRLPSPAAWREQASYALLNMTAAGPTELDKPLAVRLLPTENAGIYAAASRAVGPLVIPVVAMVLAALPRLFREAIHDDRRLTRWIFVATAAYGCVAAGALWLVAPLLEWLFDQRYAGLTQTVHWLALAVPGMSLRISAATVLMSANRPWMRIFAEASGVLVLAVVAYLLASADVAQAMPLALACAEWWAAALGWGFIVWRGKPNNRGMPSTADAR